MMVIMNTVKGAEGKSMKVSREQVAENRRTILEAASRLFRERGYESVTVAEIMKAAGLTHGGFYGYFASKDALIAGALAEVLSRRPEPTGDLADYVSGYLSMAHRDNRADGCPTAALAAETVRLTGEPRTEMTAGVKRQIARLSRIVPGETDARKRQAAIGSWAAMVGAMILARVSNDPALSAEILKQTQSWLTAQTKDRHSRCSPASARRSSRK
jgi:TetR/AcrR family transcriptional regulator, transcriptional repressor for nem operon